MAEKDTYGEKIRDIEKAREDQWAREQDQELIRKMRGQDVSLNCPRCHKQLVSSTVAGHTVMTCPDGHGGWLEAGALRLLSEAKER